MRPADANGGRANEPPSSKAEWDFRACPVDERFSCLNYSCKREAYRLDPSFADSLSPDWKAKYPNWPKKAYLEIPEHIRRAAQPEFQQDVLKRILAQEMVPTAPVPLGAFNAFESCIANGEPPIYEDCTGAYALIKIPRGKSPAGLRETAQAYADVCLAPHALGQDPEGAGSYARQLQAELNAVSAFILLRTRNPADVTAYTAELFGPSAEKGKRRQGKHRYGLYNGDKEWRNAAARGELLVKKSLKGRLDAFLVSERLAERFLVKGPTKIQ